MKIPGKEEVGEFGTQLIRGFGEGALVGLPLAYGLRYLLDRRTGFRNAGGFPRALFLVAPPVFCGATWMEVRSREFEEQRRERLKAGLGSVQSEADSAQPSLETGIVPWMAENKYKCIVGGWAAVLGGSFYYVNKDPYLTRAQKLVQARVWAQGATVIMLVASVVLSVGNTSNRKAEQQEEARTSWQRHLKKE